MIEINLLPEELRKKEPRFKKIDLTGLDLQNLPILKIGASLVGILIGVQVILFVIGIYSKTNLGYLTKKYQGISPKKEDAIRLRKESESINRKVKAIDELMVRRFSWGKKLNSLSDSMTPGIWLSELSYDERLTERQVLAGINAAKSPGAKKDAANAMHEKRITRFLILSGYASSMGEQGAALVGKFIQSLKDSKDFYSDFKEIELGSIKSAKIEDQEVMSFRITCVFKD